VVDILFNVNEPNSRSNGSARVGTGALARPSLRGDGRPREPALSEAEGSKPSAVRQRSSPAPIRHSRAYRNERTNHSVSSETIASTPHAAHSRMRSARFTVQTMILFPAA
jgi:hypothetical protein